MHIISKKSLRDFYLRHPDSKSSLLEWYQDFSQGEFSNIEEIRAYFPHADKVGRRTVFNISGNKYRLIARINYQSQKIFVLHILTHAEYDKEKWK